MTFQILIATNILLLIATAMLSNRRLGTIASSILNPFLPLISLQALYIADFYFAYDMLSAGETISFGPIAIAGEESLLDALIIYTWGDGAVVLGILFAYLILGRQGRPKMPLAPEVRLALYRAALAVLVAGLAISCVGLVALLRENPQNSIFEIAAYRQILFRENKLAAVATFALAPATVIFIARSQERPIASALGLLAAVALGLFIMGRNQLFFLGYCAACFVQANVRHISRWLAIPILAGSLALFSYLHYAQRAWILYPSYGAMLEAEGGFLSSLFNTEHISLAEALTVVVSREDVARGPFDTLLGLLMMPLPREVFESKPVPPSSHFTSVIDPYRWDLTRSELTVTGLGNLYMEFGWLSIPALACLAALWTIFAVRSAQAFPSRLSIVSLCYCSWCVIAFTRGDLSVLGIGLWPLLVVLCLAQLLFHVARFVATLQGRPTSVPAPATASSSR